MLDKNVFLKGMQELVIFFPSWNVKVEDVEVVKKWYGMLKKFNDKEFECMISNYIKNESYSPTIAGLNKYYKKKTICKKITRREDY
jgi:hypothetical protein